jgi:hypothetical protein
VGAGTGVSVGAGTGVSAGGLVGVGVIPAKAMPAGCMSTATVTIAKLIAIPVTLYGIGFI